MITTDLEGIVEDAAAHLYVWALKDIPKDLREALAAAREKETSVPGRRVLDRLAEVRSDDAHRALSAAAAPARRPKTVHSSSELPIIRLRPCAPPAISPQANRPGMVVSERSSMTRPPFW